ncbi:Hpt domain-containing protein [Deferribacter abyssi]|uniref:Hpt domain-containing protein n=1 Tax=Deferribacter abyssi TaxID=213806 RepID=UPI003C1873A7
MEDNKLIEFPFLEGIYENNFKLVNLLQTFIEQSKKYMLLLKNAISENNYSDIKKLSHKIKGSITYLEIKEIMEVLEKLEDAAIDKKMSNIITLYDVLENKLNNIYNQINKYIENIK